MFKNVGGGKQIVEFVGFRAKLYSYKMREIRGYSHYTRSKLIDLLIKRGLIPEKI